MWQQKNRNKMRWKQFEKLIKFDAIEQPLPCSYKTKLTFRHSTRCLRPGVVQKVQVIFSGGWKRECHMSYRGCDQETHHYSCCTHGSPPWPHCSTTYSKASYALALLNILHNTMGTLTKLHLGTSLLARKVKPILLWFCVWNKWKLELFIGKINCVGGIW